MKEKAMNCRRCAPSFLRHLATQALPFFVVLFLLAGCSGKTVTVEIPPVVDLKTWPLIGIVNFAAETHAELAPTATQKFMIHLQGAQPGVRLLELGNREEVLQAVGRTSFDPDTIKAIGRRYGVSAVLLGSLEVSEVRPRIDFSPNLKSLNAKASVNGALAAKLQETSTGATVWSNGAHGQWSLAQMQLDAGGLSNVGIRAHGEKYDLMLRDLAKVATSDFRPRYQRRKVEE
jgi:hypothetical protein